MKTYVGFFVLLALALLAACGGLGSQKVVVVTSTPAPVASPTGGVNAVQTQAAASIFATQTASVPTADAQSLQTAASATATPTGDSIAPPSPPTAAPGGNASFIANVVMATDTQGDTYDPVGVTTVFTPEATFHAVVTIADAPANSSLKAEWYVVDVGSAAAPNSLIDQYELTVQGSRNVDFTLNPKTAWPQGSYRVDVYGDGALEKSVTFQVQSGLSQATAVPGGNASFIANVVMATDTQGDTYDPVGVTTTFAPEATFHAVVTIADAPDNSSLKAEWYVVDVGSAAAPNSLVGEKELTVHGSGNVDFTLNPTTAWPQGSYRVDIFGDGALVKSVTFQVEGGSSQAAAPTRTSAPSYPPGVYVTKMRISPAQPKRGQEVTFYATYVNSTGAPQGYKWFVEIYDAGTNKGIGESGMQSITVPPGTSEVASTSNWKVTGGGPCLSLYAQAQYQNPDDKSRHPFNSTNGSVVSYEFQVCPP